MKTARGVRQSGGGSPGPDDGSMANYGPRLRPGRGLRQEMDGSGIIPALSLPTANLILAKQFVCGVWGREEGRRGKKEINAAT